jgi:hypothetical protein
MATVAVVLALTGGGVAYASHLVVRSSDIANGAVTAPKIAGGAVKARKIANGAVTPSKLSFVPASGIQIVTANDNASPGSGDYYSSRFLTVSCPAGKKVIGGGYYLATSSNLATVHKNGPTDSGTGWDVWVYNGSAFNLGISGYAVCASF